MAQESQLYFKQLPVGDMANYAYLIGDRETRKAYVVDPAWNVDDLWDIAEADGMKIVGVLATHFHPDHVGGDLFGTDVPGVRALLEKAPLKVHCQRAEEEWILGMTGISKTDRLVRSFALNSNPCPWGAESAKASSSKESVSERNDPDATST